MSQGAADSDLLLTERWHRKRLGERDTGDTGRRSAERQREGRLKPPWPLK